MQAAASPEVIVVEDSDDESISTRSASVNGSTKRRSTSDSTSRMLSGSDRTPAPSVARRTLFDERAKSTSRQDERAAAGSDDDGFEILSSSLPVPLNGLVLGDSMSFSELQAQQIAFAEFQRKAQRRKSTPVKSAAPVKRKVTTHRTDTSTQQKTRRRGSTSQSPTTPGSRRTVLRKTVSRSPFEDSSGHSVETSPLATDDESETRAASERRVLVSNKREQKKSPKTPDIPSGYPQQNFAGDLSASESVSDEVVKPPQQQAVHPIQADDSDDNDDDDDNDNDDNDDVDNGDDNDDDDDDDDDDNNDYGNDFMSSTEQSVDDDSDDEYYVPIGKKVKADSLVRKTSRERKSVSEPVAIDREVGRSVPAKVTKRGRKGKAKRVKQKRVHHAAATAILPPLVSDTLPSARDATTTVIHSTFWRGIYLDDAPPNLIELETSVEPVFFSTFERSLATFDSSGQLDVKATFLPEFGKAKQLVPEELASGSETTVSVEEMNQRVLEAVDAELPAIKALYQDKVRSIMAEARAKTVKYLEAQSQATKRNLTINCRKLEVPPIARMLLQRMKQPESMPLARMKKMKYAMGDDESGNETRDHPADVYRFPVLQPLSKSTAFVGINRNIRVEDDPIMHYVPYFGDNDDGDAIDVKNYNGIKLRDGSLRSALDREVDEYLLRVIVGQLGGSESVFSSLKAVAGFGKGIADYAELKKLHDSSRTAAVNLRESEELLRADPSKLSEVLPLTAPVPTLSLVDRFEAPMTYFESNTARNYGDRLHGLGLRATGDFTELNVTYRDMFCRMCYRYDCEEHGIEHPLPSNRVDPVNPESRLAPVVLAAAAQDRGKEKSQGGPKSVENSPASVEDQTHNSDESRLQVTYQTEVVETVETVETVEVEDEIRRRSSRSLTRISSMATASMKVQGSRQENRRAPRVVQPTKKMADKSEYLDDAHCAVVTSLLKKSLSSAVTCSTACYKAHSSTDANGNSSEHPPHDSPAPTLTATESLLIDRLRNTIGENPCMISSIIKSTPCHDIYSYLATKKQGKSALSEPKDVSVISPVVQTQGLRKRGRGVAAQKTNNSDNLKRTRYQRMKDMDSHLEYEPCNHDGVCSATVCSCMTREHTCDKACSCSRDCPNRFQGCRCSYGNCRTKACPCFVAMRECNPDLCGTCGASEAAVLVFNDELKHKSALELGICCNVNIQRGLHKKLGVAFSTTHGWGAFAREPIKRGEFIYEYHGALVSQDEAERRGNIYDRMAISFLFDANEDSVVDAIRMGNKSKFANHSAVGQKCMARVMRVSGEHRISIWAKQDIEKGEELFFDYGYHGESAPDWSQRIKGSSRHDRSEDD